MRKLILVLMLLVSNIAHSQTTHCLFLGIDSSLIQKKGAYIIVVGNYKNSHGFEDSTINIDLRYPFWRTREGNMVLTYIDQNYNTLPMTEFFDTLENLINTYYFNTPVKEHFETYKVVHYAYRRRKS